MGILFPKILDEGRRIQLNGESGPFCTKYNLITFLPKSALLQFTRLSNIVFLVNAILQSIPIVSSIGPISAIIPLAFVLAVSMLREGYEDYKRHRKDWEINTRKARVLMNGVFEQVEWDKVQVGNFLKICSGQYIPADCLILHSSDSNSICYVETANLDGESNLKEKHLFQSSIKLPPQQFEQLKGTIVVENPSSNLYQFEGRLELQNEPLHHLDFNNLLLRETVLRNTSQIVAYSLYCGHDSKILKNQGHVHHKISKIEKRVNHIQIGLVILLVLLCLTSSIGYYFVHSKYGLRTENSYIPSLNMILSLESIVMFFTIFLLLNFLIPITLNILIEGIKTFSAVFLSFDRKLYDKISRRHCGVLNASILQELGMVDCVLTDKTGTLTANEMVFKCAVIEDRIYSRQQIEENTRSLAISKEFNEFWTGLVLCHEVVRDQQKQQYQGSSPDQVCFINFAHKIGYSFNKKGTNCIQLSIFNQKIDYQLISVLPFSSRRRMSVIVKNNSHPDQIIMYTKGADSAIFEKSLWYTQSTTFSLNLDNLAKEGLRTLVFSRRTLSPKEVKAYLNQKERIKSNHRSQIITKQELQRLQFVLAQQMQSKLEIIGATGIEDKLQEYVPRTISRLQKANIRVMMITGDKLQTAQNIGYLSHLIQQNYKVLRVFASGQNLKDVIFDYYKQIQMNNYHYTLIIEGTKIREFIEQSHQSTSEIYRNVLLQAKSVIFCRSTPKQKALIVKFSKDRLNSVVLAIGDGGNDVGMIMQANIGVGIIGKEGNSAAAVSDFSFGKFKFLDRLILHHGRWFYYRLSYFFVFFGLKNMTITFVIYFFLIDSAFSGTFDYSVIFYLLFNSFIGVSMLVNYGLYDQDVNDDLQVGIWDFLPEMYKQMKKNQLFSYKRFILWLTFGLILAVFLYYVIKYSLSPLSSCNQQGQIPDLFSTRIMQGLCLYLIILIMNYLDTSTHTYFFETFVFLFMSILPTVTFFICENFAPVLNESGIYTDNLNARFWLTAFLILSTVFLIKTGISCYIIEYNPTLIDLYKRQKWLDQSNGMQVFKETMKNERMAQTEETIEITLDQANHVVHSMLDQQTLEKKISSSENKVGKCVSLKIIRDKSTIMGQ